MSPSGIPYDDEQQLRAGMSPRQGAGSHDANDPTTWDVYASSGLVIGLDIGQMSDHSAYVLAGCWPQASNAVGVIGIKRFPLGMPLMQVAEEAAGLARKSNARIVCDLSNNSGFAQLLAPLLGERPANRLLAAVITAMGTHAAQAVPMAITINGKTAGIPRITLSKRELVEQIGAELDAGSLRLSKTGDWEALRHELGRLQRVARQSGSVSYQAAEGEHDDLVTALSLALYGCRRLVPVRRPAVDAAGAEDLAESMDMMEVSLNGAEAALIELELTTLNQLLSVEERRRPLTLFDVLAVATGLAPRAGRCTSGSRLFAILAHER